MEPMTSNNASLHSPSDGHNLSSSDDASMPSVGRSSGTGGNSHAGVPSWDTMEPQQKLRLFDDTINSLKANEQFLAHISGANLPDNVKRASELLLEAIKLMPISGPLSMEMHFADADMLHSNEGSTEHLARAGLLDISEKKEKPYLLDVKNSTPAELANAHPDLLIDYEKKTRLLEGQSGKHNPIISSRMNIHAQAGMSPLSGGSVDFIGKGGSGTVFVGKDKDGEPVVLKEIQHGARTKEELEPKILQAKREIKMHRGLHHTNVLHLADYAFFEYDNPKAGKRLSFDTTEMTESSTCTEAPSDTPTKQAIQLGSEATTTPSSSNADDAMSPLTPRTTPSGSEDTEARFQFIAMLFLEQCKGGNLRQFLKNHAEDFETSDVLNVVVQILQGLDYIHSKKTIHRDIKPDNILVHEENGFFTVKISDFGLSCKTTDEAATKGNKCGTEYYGSPEQLEGKPHGMPSDVYSCGHVIQYCLVQIYTNEYSLRAEFNLLQKMGEPSDRWNDQFGDFAYPLWTLVKSMIERKPEDRPTISKVLSQFEVLIEQVKDTERESQSQRE